MKLTDYLEQNHSYIQLPLESDEDYLVHGFCSDHKFWALEFKGRDLAQIEIPNDLVYATIMTYAVPPPLRIETKTINEMLSTYPMSK